MEKKKVPSDDAKLYESVVIGNSDENLDIVIEAKALSVQEMYKQFYPDTKMVKIEAAHDLLDKEIDDIIKSFDEGLGKNMKRLRVEVVLGRTVYIFASAEFKKVAEKMKYRCVIEYHNPYLPERQSPLCYVGSEKGVYYHEGLAYIDVLSDQWNEEEEEFESVVEREFAIYWRPYEEEK